ncbi:MAG: NrfD/PsrC family molybdoenzyme membrane anchor subunit, partial [Anaerolineae bacterium]
FYIAGDDVALTPTASRANFMWADLVSGQHVAAPPHNAGIDGRTNGHRQEVIPLKVTAKIAGSGTPIRAPSPQGVGRQGPIHLGEGSLAEHMVQTSYNAQHKVPWHWPVPAYLVTKGIGSGIFALLAIFFGFNVVEFNPALALLGDFVSLLFIGLTTALLVMDLDKPQLFHTILLRPQWKSWLTRGAFILIGFTVVAGLWFLVEGGGALGLLDPSLAIASRRPLLAIGFVLAIAVAIYTAFLFGQAEGRDLWQSTLLPLHLAVQAFMAGSITLLALGLFVNLSPQMTNGLTWVFGIALVVDLFITLLGEFGMPHASEIAARAAHDISRGAYRVHFWGGAIVLGHALPFILLLVTPLSLAAIAAVLTIAGLYFFEYAFVMAPQEIPNS